MGRASIINIQLLDKGLVILPERYDPLRFNTQYHETHIKLKNAVSISNNQLQPCKADPEAKYLVLDTGDAKDGAVPFVKGTVDSSKIGSNKKIVQHGDVIISRLRPYLRQVAFIDEGLQSECDVMLCSTEFFVLRSNNGCSIAYLVPLLLSELVQGILAVSQEGGHHPRFNQATLEDILIPPGFYSDHEAISMQVEQGVQSIRKGVGLIADLVSNWKAASNKAYDLP